MKKKHAFKYFKRALAVLLLIGHSAMAQTNKTKKILVIGVDGVIHTAFGYATTPGIDQLVNNASYSMNGYGGVPAYASTGWATLLTGVSAEKHGVTLKNSFSSHAFDRYPSVVSRIKSASPGTVITSVVRNAALNAMLNHEADHLFHYSSDEAVYTQSSELLKQADIGVAFIQFSSPAEVGESVGYQLREARYVQAIQQVDQYVAGLQAAIQARETYANEDWAILLVSTHGGTESGIHLNSSEEEINVPLIFSGSGIDNRELIATSMAARENTDNTLTFRKAASGDRTYVRIPINGTALQGMDRFTMELWVKAGVNSSDPSIMGDKNWDSGGNPGFTICRAGSSWKINFANHKRERYDIGSSRSIEDGNWHHLAVTFDKTRECVVYQDGEIMERSALTYKPEDDMTSPYPYICLAQEGTERYGGGAPNWAGSVNEVRIWTDVLDQQTLKNYMHLRHVETSSHPHLASLNLYLKLDEVRGNQVRDFSGRGNHGELVGPASERNPYYPIGLTDVAVNVLSHLGLPVNGSWGLEGNPMRSNVPYRLFKVN
ncbi:LamG-like jellyroll fold domain-containing protein [Parapedobacter deserti]|uniref:LamG-like jellyroll fold domain-containing protein n=1 Tax=Parapedobacter deserti TaxID=1912957 RepID=A0ABV7JPI2_9SPHI